MSLSPRKIGPVVFMLVLVHLFTPVLHSLPPAPQHQISSYGDAFAAIWGWLGSRFIPAREKSGPQGGWEKTGSQMPSNVSMDGEFAYNECDAGSHMDPDGYK